MDCVSIFTKRYTENEKLEIEIFRTCVCICDRDKKNDKMHMLFYYMDCYLLHTENSCITFKNFQILIKRYIETFLDNIDRCYFLKIFNKNYFCSLLIKKTNNVLKLYNNINFLTLFYEKYTENIKKAYNFCNVIDFLIENENLFHYKPADAKIQTDIEDITRKMEKIAL
jgi:hypothetical protein